MERSTLALCDDYYRLLWLDVTAPEVQQASFAYARSHTHDEGWVADVMSRVLGVEISNYNHDNPTGFDAYGRRFQIEVSDGVPSGWAWHLSPVRRALLNYLGPRVAEVLKQRERAEKQRRSGGVMFAPHDPVAGF